jgi:hypothetical protein
MLLLIELDDIWLLEAAEYLGTADPASDDTMMTFKKRLAFISNV